MPRKFQWVLSGAVPGGQALQDAPDMEAQAEVFKVPIVGPKTKTVFRLDIEWAKKASKLRGYFFEGETISG